MPPENTPALTTERSLTPLPACWLSDFKTLPRFVFISEHLTIRHTRTQWSAATVLGFQPYQPVIFVFQTNKTQTY